jgi:hypothetical protein
VGYFSEGARLRVRHCPKGHDGVVKKLLRQLRGVFPLDKKQLLEIQQSEFKGLKSSKKEIF